MMSKTLITSKDPKGLQAMRLFEDAYNKAELDTESAQRINECGGEFQNGITKLIVELSVSNQFADEEVESSYGYLSGYKKPHSIEEQIEILRFHWPQLNPDKAIHYMEKAYSKLKFPEWIEGPFAIIRPGFFSNIYGEEVEEILKAFKKARKGKFVNYRKGQLGSNFLQQHQRTVLYLKKLSKAQNESDILIEPAQFGIRHRGKSVRRAREVFVRDEYGSGAKDIGTKLLTHPERLQRYDDLWIDCAGDEYSSEAGGEFGSAPCFAFSFGFRGGRVRFHSNGVAYASACYGSASSFWQ